VAVPVEPGWAQQTTEFGPLEVFGTFTAFTSRVVLQMRQISSSHGRQHSQMGQNQMWTSSFS